MKRTSTWVTGLAGLAVTTGLAVGVPAARAGDEVRLAPASARVAASAPGGQPNVLLVMTDDMRHDDLKYMPNVRRFIGDRGTDFRNSFATTPLCCPNRTTYLTGQYAHNHNVWWHDHPFGYGSFDDRRTIGTALQSAGYQTGYIGKYLNGYGRMRPKADPDHTPWTFVPDGWTDWRATPDYVDLPESDPRAGSTYRYFDTTVNNNGTLEGHQGQYNSRVLVDESLEVIDRFTAADQPWYLQLNSLAPHHGGPVERDDSYLPTPARPKWVKGKFDKQIRRGPGVPRNGQPERDVSDKVSMTQQRPLLRKRERRAIRNAARQRAETLHVLDRELARVFRKLETSGELAETVVAFTSDNGYLEGEHRWQSGKVVGYEPSYRVPLLIAGPGIPAGGKQFSPVSTIDLSATVLDWAGARLEGADGRSFRPDLGAKAGWTRAVGYESYLPGLRNDHDQPGFDGIASAIGIRTAQYFYVRYSNGEAELFDLAQDPNELQSVHNDPAYAATRAELDTAWAAFDDCRGKHCVVELPASLRADEQQAAALRAHQAIEEQRYYG